MEQPGEHLELPFHTYRLLEQMAQTRRITPSEVVSDLVQQFQAKETINTLRQEYQRLTDKALMRTITRAEEKRTDVVCKQINALSAQFDAAIGREQRDRRAEELIAKSEELLEIARRQS